MVSSTTPGVIVNTSRKNGAVRDARRMAGLERAANLLGGQEVLAAVLGIGGRQLRQKMVAERPIHDADLRLAAAALSARARVAEDLSTRLMAILEEKAPNQ
jgi:hypothetical protein